MNRHLVLCLATSVVVAASAAVIALVSGASLVAALLVYGLSGSLSLAGLALVPLAAPVRAEAARRQRALA